MAVLEPSERNCARPPRGGLKLDGLAVLGLERLGVQHNLGRLWLGNRERSGKTARDTVRVDDVDEVIAGIIIGRFRDEQHGLGLANDWLAVLVPLVIEGPLPMDFSQKGHSLAKRPDLRLCGNPDGALSKAAKAGNIEAAKQAIADVADVNARQGNRGGTPLDFAMRGGHLSYGEKTDKLLRQHGGKTGEELKAAGN